MLIYIQYNKRNDGSMRRRITEPQKKVVAARQGWRCSHCGELLAATYQVDHTVALCNGGEDTLSNLTAMCVSCHATKTQWEHIERARNIALNSRANAAPTDIEEYPDRQDIVHGSYQVCSVCHQRRPSSLPWESHRCPGPLPKIDLSCYAYTPAK